jgi:hypothetical protein
MSLTRSSARGFGKLESKNPKMQVWWSLTSGNGERMEEIAPEDEGINRSILGNRLLHPFPIISRVSAYHSVNPPCRNYHGVSLDQFDLVDFVHQITEPCSRLYFTTRPPFVSGKVFGGGAGKKECLEGAHVRFARRELEQKNHLSPPEDMIINRRTREVDVPVLKMQYC